jgi:hypothetical protein
MFIGFIVPNSLLGRATDRGGRYREWESKFII